jgi:hypothetical protein
MPIHVLKVEKSEKGWDYSKVIAWADEYVRARDYVVIQTDENEIILEPRKSTRPLDFAYVKLDSADAVKELARQLSSRYGIKLIEVKSLAWDIEKSPYIKTPIEGEL